MDTPTASTTTTTTTTTTTSSSSSQPSKKKATSSKEKQLVIRKVPSLLSRCKEVLFAHIKDCESFDGLPTPLQRELWAVAARRQRVDLSFVKAFGQGEVSDVVPVRGITKKALSRLLEGESPDGRSAAATITKLSLSPTRIPAAGPPVCGVVGGSYSERKSEKVRPTGAPKAPPASAQARKNFYRGKIAKKLQTTPSLLIGNQVIEGGWFKKLVNLTELNLSYCRVKHKSLCHLKDLTALHTLSLSHTTTNDKCLNAIAQMKSLTALDISYCTMITTAGLELFLSNSNIGPNLEKLNLSKIHFDDCTFLQGKYLPKLWSLQLAKSKMRSGQSFPEMPELTELNLYGNPLDRTDVTKILGKCPKLLKLDISHTSLADFWDTNWVHMFKECKNLQVLDLSHCPSAGRLDAKRVFEEIPSLLILILYGPGGTLRGPARKSRKRKEGEVVPTPTPPVIPLLCKGSQQCTPLLRALKQYVNNHEIVVHTLFSVSNHFHYHKEQIEAQNEYTRKKIVPMKDLPVKLLVGIFSALSTYLHDEVVVNLALNALALYPIDWTDTAVQQRLNQHHDVPTLLKTVMTQYFHNAAIVSALLPVWEHLHIKGSHNVFITQMAVQLLEEENNLPLSDLPRFLNAFCSFLCSLDPEDRNTVFLSMGLEILEDVSEALVRTQKEIMQTVAPPPPPSAPQKKGGSYLTRAVPPSAGETNQQQKARKLALVLMTKLHKLLVYLSASASSYATPETLGDYASCLIHIYSSGKDILQRCQRGEYESKMTYKMNKFLVKALRNFLAVDSSITLPEIETDPKRKYIKQVLVKHLSLARGVVSQEKIAGVTTTKTRPNKRRRAKLAQQQKAQEAPPAAFRDRREPKEPSLNPSKSEEGKATPDYILVGHIVKAIEALAFVPYPKASGAAEEEKEKEKEKPEKEKEKGEKKQKEPRTEEAIEESTIAKWQKTTQAKKERNKRVRKGRKRSKWVNSKLTKKYRKGEANDLTLALGIASIVIKAEEARHSPYNFEEVQQVALKTRSALVAKGVIKKKPLALVPGDVAAGPKKKRNRNRKKKHRAAGGGRGRGVGGKVVGIDF